MTNALHTAVPTPELMDQDRKVAEIGAEVAPEQREYRPLHWLPGAGLMPSDFFLPGLA